MNNAPFLKPMALVCADSSLIPPCFHQQHIAAERFDGRQYLMRRNTRLGRERRAEPRL